MARLPKVAFSVRAMMGVLIVTNLINYIDRGIVPGANDAFTAFIVKHASARKKNTYLGALQSAFIVGFSLGSIAVGGLVHHTSPFGLAACGLVAWCAAACVAGAAKYAGSYWLLLFGRACSGLGEAGFVTVGGPWLQDAGGSAQGAWLGAFYAMIPTGTAIGYGYGVAVADSLTWSWAFFIEAMVMAPLAVCFAVSLEDGSSAFVEEEEEDADSVDEDDGADFDRLRVALGLDEAVPEEPAKPPTFWAEAKLCLAQPYFVWVALGYAAYAGSIVGFSTFAPQIAVGLGLWSKMANASIAFSVTIAVSGILGTPLGGLGLDWLTRRRRDKFASALELTLGLVTTGCLFVAYAAVATDRPSFLGRLFVGTLPLFAATAPMNVALFESVPRSSRALGSSLGVLIMHACGDVPTPILIGAAKDALAPDCTPRGKHDRLGPRCSRQRPRLRLVGLACAAWLVWAIVAFGIAYCKRLLQVRRNQAREARLVALRQPQNSRDVDDDDDDDRVDESKSYRPMSDERGEFTAEGRLPVENEPRLRILPRDSEAPLLSHEFLPAAANGE